MLSVSEIEHPRKLIKNFVVKYPRNSKLFLNLVKKYDIVNHFLNTGFVQQTVYIP